MMFERYTDRARRALVIAQDEARNLGQPRIGAGHLLLGLIGEDGGVAAVALKSLGADLGEARHVMDRDAIHGVQAPARPIPFTSRAEGVLKRAVAESLTLGHPYIATEHLLLALISDSEGTGNDPLVAIGINPADARAKVMELLRGYEEAEKRPLAPARKYDGTDPDLPDGWLHEDGTPCPEYLAPDDGTRWWCTEHQQHLKRPAGDPLTAALDLYRSIHRETTYEGERVCDSDHHKWPCDASKMLAALEKLAKAADRWQLYAAEGDAADECADDVRRIMTRELTGEGQ